MLKILESPLDCKEIKPVHPKGNQSWIFFGRTDVEGETLILWPPDVKNWLIGKDPEARKDWRQEEKRTTEDEMVGWHHWLNGHEFEQTLGDGKGQGGLVCCSPGGCKESDTTEWLNNNNCNGGTRLSPVWLFVTPWIAALLRSEKKACQWSVSCEYRPHVEDRGIASSYLHLAEGIFMETTQGTTQVP